jgi:hypothetical protein
MHAHDLTWLAGLLEGEASFLMGPPCKPNRPRILLSMTDIDVVQRAASLLEIGGIVTRRFPSDSHKKPAYVITLYGSRAVRVMRTLLPLMSKSRIGQIGAAIESYRPRHRTKHDHTSGIEFFGTGASDVPLFHDIYWLAGVLEAEGSFLRGYPTKANQPRIQVTSTDEDVISWIATWLGVKYVPLKPRAAGSSGTKQPFYACVSAGPAVRLMRQLYPLMGKRRQEQIECALASYDPNKHKRNTSKLNDDQVLDIYKRAHAGERQKMIASEYNIDRSTIADIKRAKSWGWLTANK